MKLIDALELKRGDVVSLIGSGGKTSALIKMMHECQARGWRVLMTTTTRIGLAELSHFPTHLSLLFLIIDFQISIESSYLGISLM